MIDQAELDAIIEEARRRARRRRRIGAVISMGLLALGLVLYIGGGGFGGGSEPEGAGSTDPAPGGSQANASTFRLCHYDDRPGSPGPGNRVRVAGGATCAEAAALWSWGPAFQDLKPHRMEDMLRRPSSLADWTCRARQPGGKGALRVRCWEGQRRVHFRFA